MAKQILRIAKIHTFGQIQASAEHTFRERLTRNADGSKASLNVHTTSKASDIVSGVKKRLEALKVRSNAVRCVEFLITASPDYFLKSEGKTYFNDAKKWIEEKYGKENLVSSHIHRDEKTPHAVFYVVPIDKKGKLNARSYFGGRALMRGMQDSFFEKVAKKRGLERGVRGSKADHETIAEYYARVNAEVAPIPSKIDFLLMNDDAKFELSETRHVQRLEAEAKIEKLERERVKLASKNENVEATLRSMRSELDMHKSLTKKTALLLKNSFSAADFAKAFGIELIGKADIFDALQKSGEAQNFDNAVAMVLKKMPIKTDIVESAKWAQAYEDAPSPPLPKPTNSISSEASARRFR